MVREPGVEGKEGVGSGYVWFRGLAIVRVGDRALLMVTTHQQPS